MPQKHNFPLPSTSRRPLRVRIADITADGGTQIRMCIDPEVVEDYMEAMKRDETEFPPVVVFRQGEDFILADGFHRLRAAELGGWKDINADVRLGGRVDALRFALGANARHGLRRTNADKRRSVELALAEWPTLSSAELARVCAVGRTMVEEVRRAQPVETTCSRVGADGKSRRLPVPQPATARPPMPKGLKPAVRLDKTGYPIPEDIIELWDRAEESRGMLSQISTLRGQYRRAQDAKDPVFAEVNFPSLQSHLDQAFADAKVTLPYAVCTCRSADRASCLQCGGRGFMSQFRWDTCVPDGIKAIRAKDCRWTS